MLQDLINEYASTTRTLNLALLNYFTFVSDQKVLILGAGMSGITAAKTLIEAGYHNIQIIEASDKFGGRIREASIGNVTVELGAMWIYGRGSNPIYEMAMDSNLTMTDSFVDDWTVRDEGGVNLTDAAGVAHTNIKDALHKLSSFSRASKQLDGMDLDVMSGIRHFDWLPRTTVDHVIEAYALDFETGVHPTALSSFNLVIEQTFEDFGSYDMLAVTDNRGFSTVVKQLCENILTTNDTRILLNRTVESIQYKDTGVSVLTNSGEVINGDFAIVTFSLGVLQQRQVKFYPPLPKHKQISIDKFGFASYSHIYVQYPYSFWDDTMYLLYASKVRGRFSFWQNMNEVIPGCNILQLSLFAEDSRWAERSSDVEILQIIQDVLQKMYPNVTIPSPSGHQVSRWNSDPNFHGAFSYWPAAFTDSDMEALRAPVGRVYFAGEHLHPVHYGFVHGAYLSGVHAANSLVRCMETNHCDCDSKDTGLFPSSASFVIFGPTILMQKCSFFFIYCLLIFYILL